MIIIKWYIYFPKLYNDIIHIYKPYCGMSIYILFYIKIQERAYLLSSLEKKKIIISKFGSHFFCQQVMIIFFEYIIFMITCICNITIYSLDDLISTNTYTKPYCRCFIFSNIVQHTFLNYQRYLVNYIWL